MEWNATWDDAQKKINAITSLNPHVRFNWDGETLKWADNNTETIPTEAEIQAEITRLGNEHKNNKYKRDRLKEYPTIEELVVALYDTDDKADIEKRRAEVKAKYPKE